MLCGLIIYAFAIEESMTHPDEALSVHARMALAISIFLFSFSLILAIWRATGKVLYSRLMSTLLISGLCFAISGIDVLWTLAIAFVGLLMMCITESKITEEE
jgi:low temperature requirement protein LtrA